MTYAQTARRLLKHFSKSAETGPVYKVAQNVLGGDDSPLDTGATVETKELLVDAVFISTMKHSEAGRTDIKFDRILMTRGDQELLVNDIVEYGDDRFVVVDTDPISPGVPLAFKVYLSVT